MMQSIRFILSLICLWLLLSGLFKTQLLVLGALSVILVFALSLRMRVLEHLGHPVYFRLTAIPRYWGWLLWQIVLSNIDVTRRVWRRELNIKPALRRLATTPDTEMGRVVYANSITLTPGTTTISFTPEGDILVHALHEDSLQELEDGEMVARIRKAEPDFINKSGIK